ncbi:odorant receptor Or2-like [Anoplophora glabripennis]|uniref:odorant receptor Or2-like n=1 Tax=Anoplophora glabripennis TaxID=217634 RepID=UPI000A13C5BB|nr:odorant receptor Or2-like [Anoplophora glabripennis]
MQKFDLLASFDTEKYHLTLGGFYPSTHIKYKYLYVLSCIFNLFISWSQFLSMATFSYFNSSNLEKLSEILLFCMTQFAFLNKLTNFVAQKTSLMKLEVMLQSYLLTNVTQKEIDVLENHIKEGRLLAKVYRVLCFLVVLFYALFPFLDDRSGESHKFPLPCWFPFDEIKYYYQVFFMEILSIAVGAWINSNIDILTVMMCVLATAEFEVLRNRLATILQPLSTSASIAEGDALVKTKLRDCVNQYDELLCLVNQIEITFSKGIFVQFFCSVIVICLTGFQMIVISFNSMQFFLLIVYFSCMMCQVAMYCWYGHTVMESSDKIRDACYLADWNESDLIVQKSLLMIMERAKRPAILRAGNFFELNIPTLMKILRSSYSYFAVLQRLYGKK